MAYKDTLVKYRTKRDFTKTAEPKGIAAKNAGHSYLIQKHEASHLHYDFRLELDGVLKSWAVPKGPSLDPSDKRLAMEVEDHPVAYGSFEGIIPKGQYGGGTVMLWDRGTWEPIGDASKGLKEGKLVFKLHGERLKGEWTLVRFKGHDNKRNHWFLIKHRDDEVQEGDNGGFLQDNSTSVVTGRTMQEISEQKSKVWSSNKKEKPAKKDVSVKKSSRFQAKADFPGFIQPQLATLTIDMPKGKDWVHEIKFDGYRMLAYVEKGNVRLISRNGKDWTEAFQPIADYIATLPVGNAILDGEVVAVDSHKKSNFSDLKNALTNGDYSHMQYYAFDLLFRDNKDIRKQPLLERKQQLQALLKKLPAKAKKRIPYSEHFKDEDGKLLGNVCAMNLEGIVSKRADASYISDRTKTWLKTKCSKRAEFVIGGYTLPSNGSKGIGALLLGYYDGKNLEYAGRVGTGWNAQTSMMLRKQLDKIVINKCPYVSVTVEGKRKALWVKPELVCEIEFGEWTPDGHLRHPSFEGLREDKPAKNVVRDFAITSQKAKKEAEKEVKEIKTTKAKQPANDKSSVLVGGIKITHPNRIIYPESNITKQQLAEYYDTVADTILPYIKNRPISMLRCPEGIADECFYQRHIGMGKTPNLHEIDIKVKGKKQTYLMIKDKKGLLSLIQWGVIELHPWQCTMNNLDKPDRVIFDLDPDPEVTWKDLIKAAHEVRARMSELGLESFLKTTGGKGLHIVVPLTPTYGWETLKTFARAIADSMAHDDPKRYIATMSKKARKGRIFVDYLRNEVTSTAVSAFSVRARPGATVSIPLAWEELTEKLKPSDFTIESVPTFLKKRKKDPWMDYFKVKQKIAAKYLRALNIAPD